MHVDASIGSTPHVNVLEEGVCVFKSVCAWVIDGLKTIALCARPWGPSHKHTASAQQCIWAFDNLPSLFPRALSNPPFLSHHLLFLFPSLSSGLHCKYAVIVLDFPLSATLPSRATLNPGVCNREHIMDQ